VAIITGYTDTSNTFSITVGGSAANTDGGLSEFGPIGAAYLIRGDGGARGAGESGGTGGLGRAAAGLTGESTFTGKNGKNGNVNISGTDDFVPGTDLDVGLFQSQSWGGGGGGGRADKQGRTATNSSTPNSGGGGGGGGGTSSSGSGLTGEFGIVIIRTLSTLTPTFSSPVRTDDGFTLNVTNYDPNYTWEFTVTAGATVTSGIPFGSIQPLTVSGLSLGTSATVTATANRTGYPAGSATLTSQAKNSQNLIWSPQTSFLMPGTTVTPDTATALGGADITYSLQSAGTTGCIFDPISRAITYVSIGDGSSGCVVRAEAAATADYISAITDVTFTVSLAGQSILATASTTSLTPGATAALMNNGSTGTGAITWARTAGIGVCALSDTTVSAIAAGTCVLTVTIAADSIYSSASSSVTITVLTPGGGGNAPAGGGSEPSPGAGTIPTLDVGIEGSIPTQNPLPVSTMGGSASGRILPPPPSKVEIVPERRARLGSEVVIHQPVGVSGSRVKSTLVIVRNDQGKTISRIKINLEPGQVSLRVNVPLVADGFSVNVYNTNEVGVSIGALIRSPLVQAPTITTRADNQKPKLFGTMLGKPIIFKGNSAVLSETAMRQLNLIAQNANARGQRIFVTGFARHGGGSPGELESLSTRRALSTARFLSGRGVRVWIQYWGAGSLNGIGAVSERRVEIRTSPNHILQTR
jgi:outer membrane protein OmpA-like peptidoglycan-associated protein